jgi:hypothetical protein
MRGDDREQGSMSRYRSLEDRIAQDDPLRPMRVRVDRALEEESPRFASIARTVPTTFTKHRDRLLEGDVARAVSDAVLAQAAEQKLLKVRSTF